MTRLLQLHGDDWLLACSDQHLQESEPETAGLFFEWLAWQVARRAEPAEPVKPEGPEARRAEPEGPEARRAEPEGPEARRAEPEGPRGHLVLLGDLFEVWVGDDALAQGCAPVAERLARLLQDCKHRLPSLTIHFVPGNRDFLVRAASCEALGALSPVDSIQLELADGRRMLLLHGDELCTDDSAYQAFRQQVRNPAWQADFLSQPLASRLAVAQHYRDQSRSHQAAMAELTDVNLSECERILNQSGCSGLIHGHTHRPGITPLPSGRPRWVLPDWSSAPPQRGGGLLIQNGQILECGLTRPHPAVPPAAQCEAAGS